ncbi:hypothetical protein COCNU_06G016250 [Cocos nucifera]|uniref:Magnesium transporter n=1 Tax=Cocos nucifera TaxID=13894 RepID=A0A8K0N3L9_COCNU|nr:hypothetical protein COCNU_06G016250 [Cocos nucifera]
MKNPHSPLIPSVLPKPASFHEGVKPDGAANTFFHGFGALGLKKRGHGGRSWIQIDRTGESKIVTLDKATLMRRCGLPARDLRLLDPLFVYPSTILGREKAIVVSLEQIRCIIMADDVFLMNSLDSCVLQYESELCHRLQTMKDQSGIDPLPHINYVYFHVFYEQYLGFGHRNSSGGKPLLEEKSVSRYKPLYSLRTPLTGIHTMNANYALRRTITQTHESILNVDYSGDYVGFMREICHSFCFHAIILAFILIFMRIKALELALEVASASLDSQVTELEVEIYPVLDELASSISTVNLEHVRRLKSHLLALTHRVQKVRDGIEQLMDDDGDMAEMYLTEKKERMEAYLYRDRYLNVVPASNWISTSAPVSPTCSSSGQPEKASNSTIMSFSRHESSTGSSNRGRHVEELEMLLEAYFVVTDNTSSKLLSLKEYVDDTEDFINIKLDNVRNQLIQFELLLTAATFVVTIFAVVTGVFGMNFEDSVFERASNFNWVLIISSISCAAIYLSFLLYVKYKRLLPL